MLLVALDPRAELLLLEHVGQLVGEQPPAAQRVEAVLAGAEDEVRAVGVGMGVLRVRGAGGLVVTVDADAGEVGAEPRLEE